MTVNLYSSCIGDGPPVVLLHGLFGSHSNLGALARSLRPDYRVCSLDLPNHGRSQWLPKADLPAMADCIYQWLIENNLGSVILVGHSLGGKIAMQLALTHPHRVTALVVVDIAPVAYEPRHQAVFAALHAVQNAQCTSRAQAESLMKKHIHEPGVVPFLLMSLQRNSSGIYDWRFNLEGIESTYGNMLQAPTGAGSYIGPTLFVKGANSPYIQDEHRQTVLAMFPQAQLKVIANTGHWLHAEQPRLFNTIVRRFLDQPD